MDSTPSTHAVKHGFWGLMLWLPVALGLCVLGAVLGFGEGHTRIVPVAMGFLVLVPAFWGVTLCAWALQNDLN